MGRLLLSFLLAGTFASAAWADQAASGRTHPSVAIPQQVMADGKPLPAGTYELRITDERPNVGAGAPSNAQRVVEFVQDGTVVARVVAEVFPATPGVTGTSGAAGTRARAEMLRGGEFLRVSFTDADGRFLIHLPTGPLSGPAPQPQQPARIEIVTPPPASPAR